MGLHDIDEAGPKELAPVPAWIASGEAGASRPPEATLSAPPAARSPPPTVLRYFAHGVLLNLLMLLAGLVWVLPAMLLVVCGLWIGLIIAFVALLIIYGYVNAFVTELLWFPVETGLVRCFLHGLALVVASLLVVVPLAVLGALFTWAGVQLTLFFLPLVLPIPIVLVLWFVLGSMLEGYIAMHVAAIWRIEPRRPEGYGEAAAD